MGIGRIRTDHPVVFVAAICLANFLTIAVLCGIGSLWIYPWPPSKSKLIHTSIEAVKGRIANPDNVEFPSVTFERRAYGVHESKGHPNRRTVSGEYRWSDVYGKRKRRQWTVYLEISGSSLRVAHVELGEVGELTNAT